MHLAKYIIKIQFHAIPLSTKVTRKRVFSHNLNLTMENLNLTRKVKVYFLFMCHSFMVKVTNIPLSHLPHNKRSPQFKYVHLDSLIYY